MTSDRRIAHPHRTTDNLLGAMFLLVAITMFMVEVVVARALVGQIPLSFLLATRSVSQLLFPLPLLLQHGLVRLLNTPGRLLQCARGALTIVSFSTFYYAAGHLPVALSTVIGFASVLWVALLAGPLLHERVGAARWLCAVMGFGGILLAVRPSWEGGSLAILAGLVASLAVALIVMLVRRLTASERPEAIMFYSGLFTSVAFVPFAIRDWQPVSFSQACWLLLLVPCGPIGQWFQFKAYRIAETTAITPIQYVRYLLALLVGWFIFDEAPDRWNLVGAVVVVGSALWLTYVEARRSRPVSMPKEVSRA